MRSPENGEERFGVMLHPIASTLLVRGHGGIQFKDVAQNIRGEHGVDQRWTSIHSDSGARIEDSGISAVKMEECQVSVYLHITRTQYNTTLPLCPEAEPVGEREVGDFAANK